MIADAKIIDNVGPEGRCGVCGWPIAQHGRPGCQRGQCSMRRLPPRTGWHDPARYDRERAERQGANELTDIHMTGKEETIQ